MTSLENCLTLSFNKANVLSAFSSETNVLFVNISIKLNWDGASCFFITF